MNNRLLKALLLAALVVVVGCRGSQPDAGAPRSPATQGVDFLGSWAVNDTENQLFNLIVRADRTVLSNWSKGMRGARGERGSWRRTGNRLVISFEDGWTDVLMPSRYGVARQSFRPGTPLDSTPASFGSAVRVTPAEARFCGVFEGDGKEGSRYLSLLSSGLAYQTLAAPEDTSDNVGSEMGTWRLKNGSVDLAWSNGERETVEWQRGVYVSTSNDRPPHLLRPADGLAFGRRP